MGAFRVKGRANMDIKQLITFVTLSQEKNYMKTSEKLNYAPSTLAKHIHSLEDELKVQLVEYRNGKIELTYDGKRFMRYADEMLNVYSKLSYEFIRSKSNIGAIRVAGGELMVGFAFGDFFAEFEKRNRETNLQVNAICCARVPDWLNQHEVDIGFVQTLNINESEGQELVPLFEECLCLMASPAHEMVQREEVRLSDLIHQDFSYTYEDCCFTDEFRRCLQLNGARPSSELFLGSIHAVINTAKEDNRICLIPYVCVAKVQQMGLVQLNWIDSFKIYDVIMIQKGVYRSAAINALINQAKEYTYHLKKGKETKDIVLFEQ